MMYTQRLAYLITIITSAGIVVSCAPKVAKTPEKAPPAVLFETGSTKTTVDDFLYVYEKNNAKSEQAFSNSSLREYLDLYINFRLKVQEAEAMKLDTSAAFRAEFEGYRKQLAQPYLTEKKVTDALVQEAFARQQEEVSISHILILCQPDAEPKDTLLAYNRGLNVLKLALKNESFENLAKEYSEDKSASFNGGNLGYFSAFDMIYPFESAAYAMKPGDLSGPIRTRFGYHVLKMNGRRPSRGKVRVAHILVRATAGMPAEDSLAALRKAEEIHSRLLKGEGWNQMCTQFSEDLDSRERGGELRVFASGTGVPTFEDAAFALEKPEDISKPIYSPYGWHIIRLLEKIKNESFQEAESNLKTRIARDPRSEQSKIVLIERLKRENGFKENKATLDYLVSLADSSLFEGNFNFNPQDKMIKNELLLIGNRSIPGTDFLTYTQGKKRYTQNVSPGHYMRLLYQTYAEEQVLAYEESSLADKHKDYRMVVKEYREGLLLFQLMEENVWNKAQKDTVGLKAFFEQQSGQYRWESRAQVVMLESSNEEVMKKSIQLLNEPRYPSKEPPVQDVSFTLNSSALSSQDSLRLRTYVRAFVSNAALQLEVTGFAGKKEKASKGRNLGLDRANEVINVLRFYGIPVDRMTATAPVLKKGQAEPGPIANLKVYSTSKKAIEQLANQADPLALKVTEGKYQQKDLAQLKQVNMEKGEYNFLENGRYIHIRILEVEPPRSKTLDEARGQAISDYQNKLDQDWIAELRKKYPVKISELEFQKLVKK